VRVQAPTSRNPRQLGATVDGYSCVGTEVRGTRTASASNTLSTRWTATATRMKNTDTRSRSCRQESRRPSLPNFSPPEKFRERGVMMPEALDPEELMNCFTREGLPRSSSRSARSKESDMTAKPFYLNGRHVVSKSSHTVSNRGMAPASPMCVLPMQGRLKMPWHPLTRPSRFPGSLCRCARRRS